jgi:hypothetical protein
MRKAELDHLLETAVARALGVKAPPKPRAARPHRRIMAAHRAVRHAA